MVHFLFASERHLFAVCRRFRYLLYSTDEVYRWSRGFGTILYIYFGISYTLPFAGNWEFTLTPCEKEHNEYVTLKI